jgi:hypothetical protein
MYTVEDVDLFWLTSTHLRYREIPYLDYTVALNIPIDENKKLLAIVTNISLQQRIFRRFNFTLRCAYRYEAGDRSLSDHEVRSYWGNCTPESSEKLRMYRPAAEFSGIHVIQPCENQRQYDRAMRSPDEVSRRPRIKLKPRFGADYVYNLDDSIPTHHVIKWLPIIDVVYSKAAKVFFRDGALE